VRTNKKYSINEALAILSQHLISRFSLWYFKNISSAKITLIRKQGIGDAIFATGVLNQFSKAYPKTDIQLIANVPEVFSIKSKSSFSLADFPLVWMMYEHYDFSFLRKKDQHITRIIASLLGLETNLDFSYPLPENIRLKGSAIEEYIANKNYIVIQPWSGGWNSMRNWSKEKWEELVALLQAEGQLIYQIGSIAETHINGTIDLRGKSTIEESFLLIQHASLFVGVNSFGEQAAACYNVPSVILYGATHPVYSLNKNQTAVFANGSATFDQVESLSYQFQDTSLITVASVFDLVNAVLNDSRIDAKLSKPDEI
jgi:ADP-heptose:LPS heptosyltransferase